MRQWRFLNTGKRKENANWVCGIDLDSESVSHLNDEGIDCYKNIDDIPFLHLGGGCFDVIFMFHVIEHLINPGYYLDILSNCLSKDGFIVIETPNANDALLSLYHCKKFENFTYWSPHVCLYNEFTLNKMLKSIGFKALSMFQVQRYPISNHFKWLSDGTNVNEDFSKFNNAELNDAYIKILKELKICDTLICHTRRV